jgi:ribosomal-protein-serine acetyltransferase
MLRTKLVDVELRPLTPDDAAAFHALLQANREHLLRLNDDHRPQIETSQDEYAVRFGDSNGQDVLLGIWEHGRLIGHVALVHREPPRWGLGYWLSEAATGRGIATAAVDSVLAYARTELGATEVLAGVSHGNDKSVAVLTRCGFEVVEQFESYTRFRRHLP